MGQALGGGPEGPALSAGAETAERIGAYLARQRKLRGVSLDELESLTRIPKRSLERLEAGVFDADRDAFARSFVRTVALALGLDAADAVARMLPEYEGRRRVRAGLRRPAAAALAAGLAVAVLVAGVFALRSLRTLWPQSAPSSDARDVVRRPNPVYELLPEWHARQVEVRAREAWEAQLAAQDALRIADEAAARARAEAAAAAATHEKAQAKARARAEADAAAADALAREGGPAPATPPPAAAPATP